MSFTVNFLYFPPQQGVTHVAKRVLADPEDNLINLWIYDGGLRLYLEGKIHKIGALPAALDLTANLSLKIAGQALQFLQNGALVGKPLNCFTPLKLFLPKPEPANPLPDLNCRLIFAVAAAALLLTLLLKSPGASAPTASPVPNNIF